MSTLEQKDCKLGGMCPNLFDSKHRDALRHPQDIVCRRGHTISLSTDACVLCGRAPSCAGCTACAWSACDDCYFDCWNGGWACKVCTLINTVNDSSCQACGAINSSGDATERGLESIARPASETGLPHQDEEIPGTHMHALAIAETEANFAESGAWHGQGCWSPSVHLICDRDVRMAVLAVMSLMRHDKERPVYQCEPARLPFEVIELVLQYLGGPIQRFLTAMHATSKVSLSEDRLEARRTSGFGKALVVGSIPMYRSRLGRVYEIQLMEKESTWSGGLEVGVTTGPPEVALQSFANKDGGSMLNLAHDGRLTFALNSSGMFPRKPPREGLPSIDDGAVWNPEQFRVGDVLTVIVDPSGSLIIFVNGHYQGRTRAGVVPSSARLFPALGIYGQAKHVRALAASAGFLHVIEMNWDPSQPPTSPHDGIPSDSANESD